MDKDVGEMFQNDAMSRRKKGGFSGILVVGRYRRLVDSRGK